MLLELSWGKSDVAAFLAVRYTKALVQSNAHQYSSTERILTSVNLMVKTG